MIFQIVGLFFESDLKFRDLKKILMVTDTKVRLKCDSIRSYCRESCLNFIDKGKLNAYFVSTYLQL